MLSSSILTFFIFSKIEDLTKIIEFIKANTAHINQQQIFQIIITPQETPLLTQAIEEAPLQFKPTYINLTCFFQDNDIINYENGYLQATLTNLIQQYGVPDEISYFGDFAAQEAEYLYQKVFFMRKNGVKIHSTTEIHKIILIDRSVDLLAQLQTGISYESLLRQLFESHLGQYIINNETMYLNLSDDPVYSQINCLPLSEVPNKLNQITLDIKQFYAENKSLKDKTLTQVKTVGKEVKFYKLLEEKLQVHLQIVSQILKATDSEFYRTFDLEQKILNSGIRSEIEAQIDNQMQLLVDPNEVIRLAILYSIQFKGLTQQYYKSFCRNYLQFYGYNYSKLLAELLNKRMLYPSNLYSKLLDKISKNNILPPDYNIARKLLNCDTFTPISTKLIELLAYQDSYQNIKNCKPTDRNMMNYLAKLMGCNEGVATSTEAATQALQINYNTYTFKELQFKNQKGKAKQTLLVVFLDSANQNQISYCRKLNQKANQANKLQFGDKYQIMVACEKILTGKQVIQQEIEQVKINDSPMIKKLGEINNIEIIQQQNQKRKKRFI